MALLRCTANQVGTGHKLNFSQRIKLRPFSQQSKTKMPLARLRSDKESLEVFHIIDTIE